MSTTTKKARSLAAAALLATAFVLTLGSVAEARRTVKFCGGEALDCTWKPWWGVEVEGTLKDIEIGG